MKIPFSKPPMAGNEFKYLKEVLKSGWLTTSSKALRFEQEFADFIGVKYACAVNSCTAALHLAVDAIGIKKGDRVLVPTYTFTATAEVLRYVGADPVLTDVDYGTGLISPSILESALKKKLNVKALMAVHYGGQAMEMSTADRNGIMDLCNRNQIKVIEDAAHAFPAKYGNLYVGSFGDIACFSFYANKTITTGEGGMLVTNDESIYNRVKIMRLHGIDRDIWDRFTSRRSTWEYDVIAPGYKYNMPDINAAIGLAQLEKANFFRQQRQRCALCYLNELSDIPVIDLPTCIGPIEDHAWHLFPIVIRNESLVQRDDFIRLLAEKGIGTSVHYKPLHRMSYYRETYRFDPEDFPNAERLWAGTVSLPIYPDLSEKELRYICRTIKEVLG